MRHFGSAPVYAGHSSWTGCTNPALKGHGFSRAVKAAKNHWALQPAEEVIVLKGHGFSRVETASSGSAALAAEET
jgi:hypothetical protein